MTKTIEPSSRDGTSPGEVHTTIDIAAPPERVFEALTDARELATWWGGDDAHVLECDADPRPGGEWYVRTVDDDGTERAFGGEYRLVDPPNRLEQTWHASDDSTTSIVRYDLEPLQVDDKRGTRLTVTHTARLAMSMSALASLVCDNHSAAVARHQLQPAWCGTAHRVAWAERAIL